MKIGGQKVLAYSMLLGSFMTALVPLAANLSYVALIICRFLTGVVHVIINFTFFKYLINIKYFFDNKKGAVWPVNKKFNLKKN